MATANDTRFPKLRARAAARGYELVTDDSGKGHFYALNTKDRVLAAKPMTLADVAAWLDAAEADDRGTNEGAADDASRDLRTTGAYCRNPQKSQEGFVLAQHMEDRFWPFVEAIADVLGSIDDNVQHESITAIGYDLEQRVREARKLWDDARAERQRV